MGLRALGRRAVLVLPALLAGTLLGAPAASARDDAITSFDGTRIELSFFPAAGLPAGAKAPTVLFGPGWSSGRTTDPEAGTDVSTGAIGVGPLRHAGYNVLTWDPRGFGNSGGTVTVDSPDFERRDVQGLLDYVAAQPEALLDGAGDPRAGMTGASYGGGIQLVTAAFDRRLDAIVPDIAWHSLVTSLYKDQTIKESWSSILYAAGKARGRLDPHIDQAFTEGGTSGKLSDESVQWFASRGPGDLVGQIRIPTLLIEGTVDTLFTLDEATTNYGILRRSGVPVKMLWFCGGHGSCLTNPGDTSMIDRRTIAWLDRYLKGQRNVDTGARFEWLDQDGNYFAASDWPPPAAGELTATGSGTLPVVQGGGSGPSPPSGSVVGGLAAPTNASRAVNAVNVTIATPKAPVALVGAPRVTISYTGNAAPATTRIYGQIVDDATDKVLGNLVTPIPVELDGAPHTVTRPLEIVSATTHPGQTFTLQLASSTVPYDRQRSSGAVTISKVDVSVPVVRPSASPADSQGCVNAGRGLRGRRLGPARLGRTRKTQRRLLKGARLRSRRGLDRYCTSGGGAFRIGYPTRRLLRGFARGAQRRVRNRVVLILTSSRRFAVRGVKAGDRAGAARRRLRGARRVRVGRNTWYVATGKRARLLVQVRGGRVRSVGIGSKRLSGGRAGARRFLGSWRLG
jgi:ABC-2 type transport system ATP-binding protein